jgi:hypothetical protein
MSTYKVEAINISLSDPHFQSIGYLLRSANKDWSVATDTDVFGNRMLGPLRVLRREPGICINSRPCCSSAL